MLDTGAPANVIENQLFKYSVGSLFKKMTKQNKWSFSYCSLVQLERNGVIS